MGGRPVPAVVGRQAALDVLRSVVVERAARGCVLLGAPGHGKTTMAAAARDIARSAGVSVVGEDGSPPAGDGHHVVVLDDADRLDPRVLARVVVELDRPGAVAVVAAGLQRPLPPLLTERLQGDVRRVSLPPLALPDLATLLPVEDPAAAGREELAWWVRVATEGIPRFAAPVAAAVPGLDAGTTPAEEVGARLVADPAVAAAVADHLSRLVPGGADALRTLAVLQPISLADLERLVDPQVVLELDRAGMLAVTGRRARLRVRPWVVGRWIRAAAPAELRAALLDAAVAGSSEEDDVARWRIQRGRHDQGDVRRCVDRALVTGDAATAAALGPDGPASQVVEWAGRLDAAGEPPGWASVPVAAEPDLSTALGRAAAYLGRAASRFARTELDVWSGAAATRPWDRHDRRVLAALRACLDGELAPGRDGLHDTYGHALECGVGRSALSAAVVGATVDLLSGHPDPVAPWAWSRAGWDLAAALEGLGPGFAAARTPQRWTASRWRSVLGEGVVAQWVVMAARLVDPGPGPGDDETVDHGSVLAAVGDLHRRARAGVPVDDAVGALGGGIDAALVLALLGHAEALGRGDAREAARLGAGLRATGLVLPAAGDVGPGGGPVTSLTPREADIVRLVARGLSSKEVATTLALSRRTVDNVLLRAYRKLGVANRYELRDHSVVFDLTGD
ncbi:MAG: LuxR C-terminal-related transcriptional regulator [Acidimicrobiia bacterium]